MIPYPHGCQRHSCFDLRRADDTDGGCFDSDAGSGACVRGDGPGELGLRRPGCGCVPFGCFRGAAHC